MRAIVRIVLLLLLVSLGTSCRKRNAIVWIGYNETRCADKWEFNNNREKLKQNVVTYCKDKGIDIYEIEIFIIGNADACFDCECKTGRQFKCKIENKDLEDAKTEGFFEL
jgi:hypothetical protein